jgi:hypothetical protein
LNDGGITSPAGGHRKVCRRGENYLAVRDSTETDDRIAARKLWQILSTQYWDVLVSLVDAHTEDLPDELLFDDRERLFIDFGYVSDELTPASPALREALSPKAAPGLFQYYTFSDFIAEAYSMIMGKPVTPPRNGFSPEGKAVQMRRQLDGLKSRIKIILPCAGKAGSPASRRSIFSRTSSSASNPTRWSPCGQGLPEPRKGKAADGGGTHAFVEAEKASPPYSRGTGGGRRDG